MSHLIEHLVFKGTATRSAEVIARTMDSVGGQMDAFTTKENTCFYVQVLDEHLPLAVDLLTDILLHPLFDAEELEREKSVVLQEIRMVEDTPDDIIHDLFAAQIWGRHPLARPILGTRELVTGFQRDAIADHFGEEYVPPRIIIAVAGNVTHEQVVDLFSRGFNGYTRPARPRASETVKLSPGVNLVHKALEQVHLVMGFPGLAHAAPERYAMFVLNDVIGGSMSSRLFQEVRERRGLCYSVYAFSSGLIDSGMFTVHAASGPERAHELFAVIRDELVRAAEHGFRPEEISRVKAQLKMGLLAGLESSSARAEQLAR